MLLRRQLQGRLRLLLLQRLVLLDRGVLQVTPSPSVPLHPRAGMFLARGLCFLG